MGARQHRGRGGIGGEAASGAASGAGRHRGLRRLWRPGGEGASGAASGREAASGAKRHRGRHRGKAASGAASGARRHRGRGGIVEALQPLFFRLRTGSGGGVRGVLGARSLAQTARRRAHLPVELLVVLGRCASLAPLLVELDAIGDQLGHKVVLARPPPRRRVLEWGRVLEALAKGRLGSPHARCSDSPRLASQCDWGSI